MPGEFNRQTTTSDIPRSLLDAFSFAEPIRWIAFPSRPKEIEVSVFGHIDGHAFKPTRLITALTFPTAPIGVIRKERIGRNLYWRAVVLDLQEATAASPTVTVRIQVAMLRHLDLGTRVVFSSITALAIPKLTE